MSEYLDVSGIISIDEFARSCNAGKVSSELNAIHRDSFPNTKLARPALESVKIEKDAAGFRLIPAFRVNCVESHDSYQPVPPVRSSRNGLSLIEVNNIL